MDQPHRNWDPSGELSIETISELYTSIVSRIGLTCRVCGTEQEKWDMSGRLCALPGFVHDHATDTVSLDADRGIMVVPINCSACGNQILFRMDKLFSPG